MGSFYGKKFLHIVFPPFFEERTTHDRDFPTTPPTSILLGVGIVFVGEEEESVSTYGNDL